MKYNFTGRGLDIGIDGSASIPGLYAAGNATGNVRGDITSAAVFGQICGESASAYAKTVDEVSVEGNPVIDGLNVFGKMTSGKISNSWHKCLKKAKR